MGLIKGAFVILSERSESKDPERCQPQAFQLPPPGILRLRSLRSLRSG